MRFRKNGIDPMARVNAPRDIFAAVPGIWTRNRAEDSLASKKAWKPVQPSLPTVAISMVAPSEYTAYHRDDTAIGKKNLIERAIGVLQDLIRSAGNPFKMRHQPLEIAGWPRVVQVAKGKRYLSLLRDLNS